KRGGQSQALTPPGVGGDLDAGGRHLLDGAALPSHLRKQRVRGHTWKTVGRQRKEPARPSSTSSAALVLNGRRRPEIAPAGGNSCPETPVLAPHRRDFFNLFASRHGLQAPPS